MTSEVRYLELNDLLVIAHALLGEEVPIRDLGLLQAAAARPRTSAFGEDAYPDVLMKATALLQSIVKHHALVDGNKRLAWLSTYVFLRINGRPMRTAHTDEVVAFVEGVAAGDEEVAEIAVRLEALVS